MNALENFLNTISGFVWGPVMLALLLGVGIYLTVGLRFMTWRRIGPAFRQLWRGRRPEAGEGDITPFQALMTALSATIGTGNIAGVGTAIFLGGPGAIFWMWVTALFGMATKYAEAVLAVHYRETDERGMHVGGPMYFIKNGLGRNWHWLGIAFALFGMLAAFGIGNTVQSNSVAHAVESTFGLSTWISGLIVAGLAGAVIIGGIRRIAEVASALVPFMALIYVAGALIVILANITAVPAALATIVADAFTGTAAAGGFAGATIWAAIRFGVARGVFSNEAGLGSAPIAHAAAKTNDPVRQGTIGMLGTFIDTIIVCTMTALVIVITGAWTGGETGAALSAEAFGAGLPGFGKFIVTFGLVVFAFTTILGWSYYGERCAEFLFGVGVIWPYRVLWILALPIGAVGNLGMIWLAADVLNGLMAVPNLIALALLSPVVFRLTARQLNR
ncbi:MAG: sodium:alanine symporter family protein [Gammaproteobacteria bacterium]|nr:sodium:alanine symporter family protein [Gammaproteobacteria bacterium]